MAEIRVAYRRTWQVKPYETETIELGITDTVEGEGVLDTQAHLYRELGKVADRLMAERLEVHDHREKLKKEVPF